MIGLLHNPMSVSQSHDRPDRRPGLHTLAGVHLLESWALWQQGGRLKSAGLGRAGGGRPLLDEGLWRWVHVEKFWDVSTARFRSLALFVAGHNGEPEGFEWRRNPARTRLASLLELGWGFVLNVRDPIPEVWRAFSLEWNDWQFENPCPRLPIAYEADRAELDPMKRLVSIRTACELRDWEIRTVRRWCDEGKIESVKHGDWSIPLGVVLGYERPKRGRPQ